MQSFVFPGGSSLAWRPLICLVYFLLASGAKVRSAWSTASEKPSHQHSHSLLLLYDPLYDSCTALPLVSKHTDSDQLRYSSLMMQGLPGS